MRPGFLGISYPEVIPLGARILDVLDANPFDLVENRWIPAGRSAKISPMPPLSARDDIVDRGKRQTKVIEVAVAHGFVLGRSMRMPPPVPFQP